MNAFKQKSARMGATTHKKMYRAGKLWIYAGITLLGMTEVALNHQVVKADTSVPTTSTTTAASSATTAHVTDSSVKLATSATSTATTKKTISAADLLKLLPAGSTLTTTDSQYVFDLPATADATAVKALVGGYSLDKGVQLKFKAADATITADELLKLLPTGTKLTTAEDGSYLFTIPAIASLEDTNPSTKADKDALTAAQKMVSGYVLDKAVKVTIDPQLVR